MLFYMHNATSEQEKFGKLLTEDFDTFYPMSARWTQRHYLISTLRKTLEPDYLKIEDYRHPTTDEQLNRDATIRILSIFLKQFNKTERTELFQDFSTPNNDPIVQAKTFLIDVLTTGARNHKRISLVFQLFNHLATETNGGFKTDIELKGSLKNILKLAKDDVVDDSILKGITQATRNVETRKQLLGLTPTELKNVLKRLSTVKISNTKTMTSVNEMLKYSMANSKNSIGLNIENFTGKEQLIKNYPRPFLASSVICSIPNEQLLDELTKNESEFYRLLDTLEGKSLYTNFPVREIGGALGYIFENTEDHEEAFKVINKALSYEESLSFSEILTLTKHFDACQFMPYSMLEAMGN